MWAVRQAGAPPTYLVGSLHVLTPEVLPPRSGVREGVRRVENPDRRSRSRRAHESGDGAGTHQQGDAHRWTHARSTHLSRPLQTGHRASGEGRFTCDRGAADEAVDGGGRVDRARVEGRGLRHGAWGRQAFLRQGQGERHGSTRARNRAAYQFDRLDQMSPALQEAMLKSVITDLDTEISQRQDHCAGVVAWRDVDDRAAASWRAARIAGALRTAARGAEQELGDRSREVRQRENRLFRRRRRRPSRWPA